MITPGSTIGILGGGQLGRMLLEAAKRLGYRVWIYCPEADCPAGQMADRHFVAEYSDEAALAEFAAGADVVTFEFENIPAVTIELIENNTAIFPSKQSLLTAQQRVVEKSFLRKHNIPTTPFFVVDSREDATSCFEELGTDAVLKQARWGYDGKGQWRISSSADLDAIEDSVFEHELILEERIDLAKEISVVVARGRSDIGAETAILGPFENTHTNHILDETFFPAQIDPLLSEQASNIARSIARELDYVGVLCVEFFISTSGDLMVNELAPRPHNSGHLTIEAFVCSQFEQHIRGVCGLPLGGTETYGAAAMRNLLGDLWQDGEPEWDLLTDFPRAKLHLYCKKEAKKARKMGHITAVGEIDAVRQELSDCFRVLKRDEA